VRCGPSLGSAAHRLVPGTRALRSLHRTTLLSWVQDGLCSIYLTEANYKAFTNRLPESGRIARTGTPGLAARTTHRPVCSRTPQRVMIWFLATKRHAASGRTTSAAYSCRRHEHVTRALTDMCATVCVTECAARLLEQQRERCMVPEVPFSGTRCVASERSSDTERPSYHILQTRVCR
jgi:hypothetical protein